MLFIPMGVLIIVISFTSIVLGIVMLVVKRGQKSSVVKSPRLKMGFSGAVAIILVIVMMSVNIGSASTYAAITSPDVQQQQSSETASNSFARITMETSSETSIETSVQASASVSATATDFGPTPILTLIPTATMTPIVTPTMTPAMTPTVTPTMTPMVTPTVTPVQTPTVAPAPTATSTSLTTNPLLPDVTLHIKCESGGYATFYWDNIGADYYRLYRGSYVRNISGTSYTDNTITPGATYNYYVTAVFASAEGPKSNVINVTYPSSPPQSISISTSQNSASFYWDYIDAYRFYYRIYLENGDFVQDGFTGYCSFSVTNLPSGTRFYVRIACVESEGFSGSINYWYGSYSQPFYFTTKD